MPPISRKEVQKMTNAELMQILRQYPDDTEISEIYRDLDEERQRVLEYYEERQHDSGMYAQQDLIDMYRRER